jgi:maltose alpha-D-glucosyltransferase/alpha-amylase
VSPVTDESRWYQDAVIYQTHVKAFFDSDADGIGDFRGLTTKLEYLQDLGVTTLWILPFYPSPLRDDGYDTADYTGVHPSYGTLRDFKAFMREARRQGLRVITELVLNHTSDQHPWFQRSRRAPEGSPERDFYVWSDTTDRYAQARIIFQDFEVSNWAYDHVAASTPINPTSTSTTRPSTRRCWTSSTTGCRRAWMACASTPSRTCTNAREPTARTCPRPTTS